VSSLQAEGDPCLDRDGVARDYPLCTGMSFNYYILFFLLDIVFTHPSHSTWKCKEAETAFESAG
jgi:hypothetical protein